MKQSGANPAVAARSGLVAAAAAAAG